MPPNYAQSSIAIELLAVLSKVGRHQTAILSIDMARHSEVSKYLGVVDRIGRTHHMAITNLTNMLF